MGIPSNAIQVSGQGVVTADNLNTYVQWCSNLADLRQFPGLPGMQVYLQGYSAPNDGGQGEFYWIAGTGTDDSGVTTVVVSGNTSGYWFRFTFSTVTALNGLSGNLSITSSLGTLTITPNSGAKTIDLEVVPTTITPQFVTASGNVTLSAANVLNQVLQRQGTIGTATDTFPAATDITTAITPPQTGRYYNLMYINFNTGNLTLAQNTGVTFFGNTITAGSGTFQINVSATRNFLLYINSNSAVSVFG